MSEQPSTPGPPLDKTVRKSGLIPNKALRSWRRFKSRPLVALIIVLAGAFAYVLATAGGAVEGYEKIAKFLNIGEASRKARFAKLQLQQRTFELGNRIGLLFFDRRRTLREYRAEIEVYLSKLGIPAKIEDLRITEEPIDGSSDSAAFDVCSRLLEQEYGHEASIMFKIGYGTEYINGIIRDFPKVNDTTETNTALDEVIKRMYSRSLGQMSAAMEKFYLEDAKEVGLQPIALPEQLLGDLVLGTLSFSDLVDKEKELTSAAWAYQKYIHKTLYPDDKD
jgi:hypothetical protein